MFYWNTGSEIKIRGCGRDFIDDYNRVRDKENGAQALIDMFKEWTSGYTCGLPEIPQNTSFAGESESGTNGMKYEFGKIYYTSDSVPKEVQKVNKEKTKKDQGAEITPIESYLKKLDGDEEDLITYCKTYRIPLVLYVT